MHIKGKVVDSALKPLTGAAVSVLGANRSVLKQIQTDSEGRFELQAPGAVALSVYPPGWGNEAAHCDALPTMYRLEGVPRPQEADVVVKLEPAVKLEIMAYDAAGEPVGMRNEKNRSFFNPYSITFYDLEDRPATGAFYWGDQDERPVFLLPPNEPRVIRLLWTAPGYGRVICTADNRGRGFVATDDGNASLLLNVALAESAHDRLLLEVGRCNDWGYVLTDQVLAAVERVNQLIDSMQEEREPSRQAALADEALGQALLAGETLVMERAQQRIERLRKRSMPVVVQDEKGNPVPGAQIRYEQREHAFRFGIFSNPHTHPIERVPINSSPLWDRLKEMGINQLPLALLWPRVEPQQGKRTEFAEYDPWPAHLLREAGFTLKSHVALWFWQGAYPDQWGVFVPDWTYRLSLDEIKKAVYDHTKALIEYYAPYVTVWQAINEAMLYHTNALNLNLDQHMEVVASVVQAIRTYAPLDTIEVNNCQVFGEGINPSLCAQGYERVPDEFYRSLLEHGVEFDAIGMQLYYGGYMDAGLWKGGFPIRHPWDLEAIIERYSTLGKPIYITEVSVPSSHPAPDRGIDFGYWHGPWNPERQAEWVKLFYTLCYSLPQVEEITWWNPVDEGAFINDGGLLYDDYSPKPAAKTLGALTQGWLSKGMSSTSGTGQAWVHGAAGEYQLVVEIDGEVLAETSAHLDPEKRSPFVITLS